MTLALATQNSVHGRPVWNIQLCMDGQVVLKRAGRGLARGLLQGLLDGLNKLPIKHFSLVTLTLPKNAVLTVCLLGHPRDQHQTSDADSNRKPCLDNYGSVLT